jgi:hypothetical protein
MAPSLVSGFIQHWQVIAWLIGGIVLGLVVHYLLFKIGRLMAQRTHGAMDDSMVRHCRGPMRLILPLLFCNSSFR